MADIVIRPSMKFIKAGYVCALLVVCAAIVVHYKYLVVQYPDQRYPYLPIASLLILLWPIKRHLQRQTVKLTMAGDKLRYETGLTYKIHAPHSAPQGTGRTGDPVLLAANVRRRRYLHRNGWRE